MGGGQGREPEQKGVDLSARICLTRSWAMEKHFVYKEDHPNVKGRYYITVTIFHSKATCSVSMQQATQQRKPKSSGCALPLWLTRVWPQASTTVPSSDLTCPSVRSQENRVFEKQTVTM